MVDADDLKLLLDGLDKIVMDASLFLKLPTRVGSRELLQSRRTVSVVTTVQYSPSRFARDIA